MKTLQFKNPEEIKSAIKQEIASVKDGRYVRRLDAILLIAEGRNAYEVAEIFGFSPRSIHGWINAVEENKSLTVLKDDPRPGRPGNLSDTQKNELREIIARPPIESGYEYSRWDGKLLSAHISQAYGILLGVRRCQKLFHELGFSYIRPRKMAYGGSEEAKEEFKKN